MSTLVKNENQVLDDDKISLIKRTLCKGATNEELELFLHACKRTGLDPLMKQAYSIPRWDSTLGMNVRTIQTSIDGFRLIAERTGRYSPGKEADYSYDKDGNLVSATAHIKKMTADGTWHEISCTAFYKEYVQCKKDGNPSKFWEKMPHIMLAKCAESLALRKSFPAELSGIYTKEEMEQSTTAPEKEEVAPVIPQIVDSEKVERDFWDQIPANIEDEHVIDYLQYCGRARKMSEQEVIEEAVKDMPRFLDFLRKRIEKKKKEAA